MPCIKELDAISDLYQDWIEETGVSLIAVSVDDSRTVKRVKSLISGKGWEYDILLDTNNDLKEGGRTVKAEVFAFLKRDPATYDLILADPPYWKGYGDIDLAAKLLALPELPERLAPGGYLIAEISSSQPTPASPYFRLVDRREYGSSAILIFAHPEA